MPRECLKIIESKSKVRQSLAKAVVAKVSTSSSTPAISFDVAELKDMVKALLLGKKNQSSAPTPSTTPAPVKVVEPNCVNQAPVYQAPIPQTQSVSQTDFESYVKANNAILRNMQSQGTLPGNTITNPKEELKGITTRSGVAYQGPKNSFSVQTRNQGCALLRKKFKEDLFTYCIENRILKDSSEPSNDNTNVVNDLQDPFVVKQDPGKNSSQSPPQINYHCCYRCSNLLEDIFCHQCTCELCRKGAYFGYNCLPKVPIVPNPEPFNNQTIYELPQTVPSFDSTCYYEDGNLFTYDSKSNIVHDSPNVFDPLSQPRLYSCEFYENDARYGHYYTPQFPIRNHVTIKTLISQKVFMIFNN
nr:hypothetical protein [Tanacetum cinerariifolium]